MTEHPLAAYRRRKKMSQDALGAKVGCKGPMISLIESWDRLPSSKLAGRIEAITGIDARILLGIAS